MSPSTPITSRKKREKKTEWRASSTCWVARKYFCSSRGAASMNGARSSATASRRGRTSSSSTARPCARARRSPRSTAPGRRRSRSRSPASCRAPSARRGPRRRSCPSRCSSDPLLQLARKVSDRDAILLKGIPLTQCHCVIFDALVVDRDGERGADLVLAAVALADVPARVVLGAHPGAQVLVDLARELGVTVLAQQRQHRDLDRRDLRVQPQHRALLAPLLVLVEGVAEQREDRAAEAGGRLDHVREVALLGLRVDVLELLAAELLVLAQVEVAAVGDALELAPADRVEVLDVAGGARVVAQLIRVVGAQAQLVAVDAEPDVPLHALLEPVLEPLLGL